MLHRIAVGCARGSYGGITYRELMHEWGLPRLLELPALLQPVSVEEP
jgi:hypothetical protein